MTFQKIRSRNIPAMQAEVQEYEEPVTGARHIHLATDQSELVFLVGFPTVPDVSDGRAHILEHLALCGSERYPVRDPFFAMLRRSTAHFMNAMTYPDKTVYPFASTDRTDFFNLLDVYLDAAFFPRLDYLDFLQEGWRLGMEEGKLAYHGVVFNEMKGAFADPVRALDTGIAAHLLAGTTYAVESGGDPLDIPSLTHEALKEFHATHYHPSQAVFMTAGRIDPREIQQVIEDRVLSRISNRIPRLTPELAPVWPQPRKASIIIPGRDHGVQIAWLLGETVDTLSYFHASLLDAGLLSNAAAPLAYAMESAGYGRPSAMNGADTGMRQIVFHLGMEGLREDQVNLARDRIWSALEAAARDGVPHSVLEATLRDIRFRQREIVAGSTPNALRRLLHAMPFEMYGGDIMNGFDNETALEELQLKIADPEFFKGLVRGLLDNPTRLDANVDPDPTYFEKRKTIEDKRLAALQSSMSVEEKDRVHRESEALLERQRQPVNNDILPRIRPQDVSPVPRPALTLEGPSENVISAEIASNGISYARVLFDLSDLEEHEWPWLQLYIEVVPELGIGSMSYQEADAWRHARVPLFDIDVHAMQTQDGEARLRIMADFYVKGLQEEKTAIAEVINESIRAPRFDEYDRLAYLIDSSMQEMRDDLADNGDDYAKLAATSPISPLRHFEENVRGTVYLKFFRNLHAQSQSDDGIRSIARHLSNIHQRILSGRSQLIVAGSAKANQDLVSLIPLPESSKGKISRIEPGAEFNIPGASSALHAEAQINHCYAAWPAPPVSHPDAPALTVLGEILTNGILHQALREEGGAYGGQAAYSSESNLFLMMSYRDPRLAATFQTFEQAIEWVMSAELSQESVEEAIIGVVQSLDKPRTPYEEVTWAWEQQQQRIGEEVRRAYRQGVLTCSAAQVKTVAATWLRGKLPSRSAFVGNPEQDLAGLTLTRLAKLVE